MPVRSRFLLPLIVFCWLVVGDTKAFHIRLSGVVTEYFTGDPMKGVQIRLVKDSIERATVVTGWNGRYEIFLERGYDYLVWFHRSDLTTKFVRIDARAIPLHPDVPFYDMDLQMTMFTWIDDFDMSLFHEPMGIAEYKHSVRNLNWDITYTQQRRELAARFMIEYQREIDARSRAPRSPADASRERRRKRARF